MPKGYPSHSKPDMEHHFKRVEYVMAHHKKGQSLAQTLKELGIPKGTYDNSVKWLKAWREDMAFKAAL